MSMAQLGPLPPITPPTQAVPRPSWSERDNQNLAVLLGVELANVHLESMSSPSSAGDCEGSSSAHPSDMLHLEAKPQNAADSDDLDDWSEHLEAMLPDNSSSSSANGLMSASKFFADSKDAHEACFGTVADVVGNALGLKDGSTENELELKRQIALDTSHLKGAVSCGRPQAASKADVASTDEGNVLEDNRDRSPARSLADAMGLHQTSLAMSEKINELTRMEDSLRQRLAEAQRRESAERQRAETAERALMESKRANASMQRMVKLFDAKNAQHERQGRELAQQISVLQSQVEHWKKKEEEVRQEFQNPRFSEMDCKMLMDLEDGYSQKLKEVGAVLRRKLERERRELLEKSICVICMDNQIDQVFLPCGHHVCCQACASQIDKCPLDRMPITSRFTTLSK